MNEFFVRFWGVRGSLACPGPKTVRYGGNTSCLEIRCDDHLLIFDAGTGLHALGKHLLNTNIASADLFITHTHLDHINGFPFFAPAYDPRNRFNIWGHQDSNGLGIKAAFQHLMQAPLFPVPLEVIRARVDFRDFKSGETLAPSPDIRVRTVALNHPGHATGYRVDYHGRSICYLTDTEHYPDRLDNRLLTLIEHADMVIYDATYTDDEYPAHQGWGHSTWREGVKLCQAGGVSNFVAFHHAPEHDDELLDRIAAELYKVTELRSVMAREGMTLHLPQSVKGQPDS